MGDKAHTQDKTPFFAQWRKKLIAAAPVIKAEAARAGMLGIGVASIAMLVNDPALFPQLVTGMLGSFITDKLRRWREAEKDADAQRKLIEADLRAHTNHPKVQALFQQLDLADVVTQAVADRMDTVSDQLGEVKALLQHMLDAGWATREQIDARFSQGLIYKPTDSTIIQNFIETQIIQSRAYRADALHQLRPVDDKFTGRTQEIEAILNMIPAAQGDHAGDVITITSATANLAGMGGVGKTALANLIGHLIRDQYPDAQLFLELGAHSANPRSPAQVLAALLQAIYPEERPPESEAELRARYLGLLSGKRAVVIIDDCAGDADAKALLPPPGCVALITSRDKLATGKRLRLPPLPERESIDLLRRYRPTLSDAEAEALAKLCANLPIALRVAGSLLSVYETMPATALIADLEGDRIGGLVYEGDSVERVFAASYKRLSGKLQVTWRALAVMPADFDRDAAVAVGEFDPNAAPSPLDELARRNLLEYDPATGRFRWHDLLRAFAGRHLDEGERAAALRRHARHFIGVGEECGKLYQSGRQLDGLHRFDAERPHLEQAFATLKAAADAEAILALVNSVAYTSSLRFTPRRQIEWWAAALDIARQIGDRSSEGNHLGNLGNAYYSLGEVQTAIGYVQQALDIARAIGDRRSEGKLLGNLGNAYYSLGEVQTAIGYVQQALDIARAIGDRRSEGKWLGNLGNAYYSLGDVQTAIGYYRQALDIARQLGDRRSEGTWLGGLGNAYRDLGDVQTAIGYYQQALDIARAIGDRRSEGTWLGNLGNAYYSLGDVQTAIGYYRQALDIARQLGDRSSEGNHLGNLGNAYYSLGDVQTAIGYVQQALDIARAIGDRRSEGKWLGNLGNAYYSLGDVQTAIDYYRQALDIARQLGDRSGEGNHLGNLGNAYLNLGEVQTAIGYHQQALDIARQIGDRSSEGNHLGNLGNAYLNLGDVQTAIGYYRQALAIARQIGDRRSEGTWLGGLGNAYYSLGEVQTAIGYVQQALDIARQIGDRSSEGNHLGNLGNAYLNLGDVQTAIDYYRQALDIARQIGDRRSEGTWLGNLGNAYRDLGDVQTAIDHYRQALAIARQIGDRRSEGRHLGNLGNAYLDLGDEQRASEAWDAAIAIYQALELPDEVAGVLSSKVGLHERHRDYTAALALYDQAVALSPANPMWLRNRASAHIRLKDAARATADLDQAERLQPDHPYLALRRGEVALLRQDYAQAAGDFEQFIAARPGLNVGYFALARALFGLRQPEQALAQLDEALARTHDSQDVRDGMDEIESLRQSDPGIVGLDEALARLQAWLDGRAAR